MFIPYVIKTKLQENINRVTQFRKFFTIIDSKHMSEENLKTVKYFKYLFPKINQIFSLSELFLMAFRVYILKVMINRLKKTCSYLTILF